MKRNAVACAVMAVTLLTSGFTFAQGYGEQHDRGRNSHMQRGDRDDRRDHNYGRRDERDAGRDQHFRRDERGAGPDHHFRRGGRLPMEYRHRQYVVDDWRGHRLSAPPRGYHWVQVGSDYVLVAITTGIILQLLLNN
ncbi:MAG: RcnB family protein [Burkholderiaceae bacterium]|nr:RcnB family protein [Burkholderiaceae bacterium]